MGKKIEAGFGPRLVVMQLMILMQFLRFNKEFVNSSKLYMSYRREVLFASILFTRFSFLYFLNNYL